MSHEEQMRQVQNENAAHDWLYSVMSAPVEIPPPGPADGFPVVDPDGRWANHSQFMYDYYKAQYDWWVRTQKGK